jgi:hypothetical protein
MIRDTDRHSSLREMAERARRHAEGDHDACLPGACLVARLATPQPRDPAPRPLPQE